MFWVLLCLLLLACLAALGLTLLTLWRRVKQLGRQVAEAGDAMAAAQRAVEDAQTGGPLEVKPCPTCGTAVQARVLREAAARS